MRAKALIALDGPTFGCILDIDAVAHELSLMEIVDKTDYEKLANATEYVTIATFARPMSGLPQSSLKRLIVYLKDLLTKLLIVSF